MVRRPSFAEMCLQAVIVALMLLWLFELYQASLGVACSETITGAKCYEWGASGPGLEFWHYRSKELYLVHLVILVEMLAIGLVLPFFTASASGAFSGLAILVWIYLSGNYAISTLIY